MPAINPYLNFNGNTEEAFNFYKSVFGGEFATVMRFKDMPSDGQSPNNKLSDKEGQQIMHIALPIAGGDMLMGSDVPEHFGKATAGTNFHICISPTSQEEATQLFNGLSAGGKITMPLEKTFWGAFFGMCTDKFGIQWMVNYDQNPRNQ
jgi:PhnB protein